MNLNNQVKIEKEPRKNVVYPDARFLRSTILFPAGNPAQSESFRATVKRTAENNLLNTISKIAKGTDLAETTEATVSDDCIIIEPAQKKIKVDVIDLTEDDNHISPILCNRVRTTFMNMKPNTFKVSEKIGLKVESDDEICEIIYDSNVNEAIQEKLKENNHADSTIHSTGLGSKIGIKTENDRRSDDHVDINRDSVHVKNGINSYLINTVPMKTEQIENCAVSNISVSSTYGVNQRDTNSSPHLIESENKTNKSKRGEENNVSVSAPSTIIVSESFPGISFGTENLLHVINKQHTNEKVQEWLSSCSIKNEKPHENVVFDKSTDTSHSLILTSAQIKHELEDIYSQKISFSCDRTQQYQHSPQKNTNTSILSTETLTSNEPAQINTYRIADIGISMDEQESFSTPMLRYLNLNTEVDLYEISSTLSYLHHMIKIQEDLWQITKKKDNLGEPLSSNILRQILDKVNPNEKSHSYM